jgi:regulator of RNase E activity RraA
MITIGPAFRRPAPERLALLRELPSATVSDVLGPGHAMHARIKPLAAGMRLLGPAFTLKLPPLDNLGMHAAVRHAEPGDVIVADQDGQMLGAPVGEIMATAARAKGLAGIVLDGAVRDAAALRESGWPVFAAGVHAQQCQKIGPAWLNQPISCGGVPVRPGDIVLADEDGVVVIPAHRIEDVAQQVATRVLRESDRLDAIRRGHLFPSWLDQALADAGVVHL